MKREARLQLLEQLTNHIEEGRDTLVDNDMVCPASMYGDPARLIAERRLMRLYPIIVGHSTELKNPGDFITEDSLGPSILVVRQQSGELRAFLNVCRHRGAQVCVEKKGSAGVFVCPYHAWSFNIDGSLRKASPSDAFPSIDAKSGALVEFPVQERHGLIWVVPTPGAKIDVEAHLGSYDSELGEYGLKDFVVEREDYLKPNINWKYVMDGFLEAYHITKLHTKTIAPYVYGNHSIFTTEGLNSRLVTPRKSFNRDRKAPPDENTMMADVAINYGIFPNSIIVWQGDHFEAWTLFPTEDPRRSNVRVRCLTTKAMAESSEYKLRWDKNWKVVIDTIINEDWAVNETAQRNLPYLTEDRVVFGRNEPGLQHFYGNLSNKLKTFA